MKTKMPDFDLLEFQTTPDYSPRVSPVRLSTQVRERGRKLTEIHTTKRNLWEMVTSFHRLDAVIKKPTISAFSHDDQIVTANAVSDEVAPLVWGDDEPDVEDEILVFHTPSVRRRARVVSNEVAPFVWAEEVEWSGDALEPPVPTIETKARVSAVTWGQPDMTEIDDVDCTLFDE